MAETDENLLAEAALGSQEAFTQLYRRHQGRVYRFAMHLSGSSGVADEVTQEVFLALLENRGGFDHSRGALLPYLMGMTRRMVYRSLRKSENWVPLDEGIEASPATESPAGEFLKRESIEALRRAVASLPPAYREVVLLCELEELDYAQAAQVLGCAIGTVRSRLHRARALLMDKWNSERGRNQRVGCSL